MIHGVSTPTPIHRPRVVRVSNVQRVRRVAWQAAILMLLFAAGQAWWFRDVPQALFAVASAISVGPAILVLYGGTWTADERGIEFMPCTPRLRRWQFIEWPEVERVQWHGIMATLVSRDGAIRIFWKELQPADHDALWARLEASLGEDFDVKISPQPWPSWRRIAAVCALPVCSMLLCAALLPRGQVYMPILTLVWGVWVWAGFAAAIIVYLRMRRDPTSPLRWRNRARPPALIGATPFPA